MMTLQELLERDGFITIHRFGDPLKIPCTITIPEGNYLAAGCTVRIVAHATVEEAHRQAIDSGCRWPHSLGTADFLYKAIAE